MTVKTETKPAWRGLTTEEWEQLAPLIPQPQRRGMRRKVTDRQLVDTLLYREYTGTPWSRIPGLEDSYLAIMKRYSRWREDGTLQRVLRELDRMGLLPPEEPPEEDPAAWTQPLEWWELTNEQWEEVAYLFPPEQPNKSGRYRTNRQILNALLYKEYTDVPWRELPKELGPWRTIYSRCAKWQETGLLDLVFDELRRLGILSEDKYLPPEPEEQPAPHAFEWWELTDEQWAQVAHLLPPAQGNQGRYRPNREVLNALLYREYTNTPWRDLPQEFGSWRTLYSRCAKWQETGVLDHVFNELQTLGVLTDEKYLRGRGSCAEQDAAPEWWELTDAQWQRLASLFPLEDINRRGQKVKGERQMLNAILYKLRTKSVWLALPEKYGSWSTVVERYRRWLEDGTLAAVLAELDLLDLLPREKAPDSPQAEEEHEAQPAPRAFEWWELTDEQWAQIAPLFPPEQADPGKNYKTNRQILDALLYREYTDTPWRDLPQAGISWRTVFERYARWKQDGLLGVVFSELKRMGVISDEKYLRGRKVNWEEDPLCWWELSDEQWGKIYHLFPPERPEKRGRRGKSNREMLNAILCRYKTGTPWLSLPQKYGAWRTVVRYYQLWRDEGLLDRVFAILNAEQDSE